MTPAIAHQPTWCTRGTSCDHGEHWSDDLMTYTPASLLAADGMTEVGLPPQIGAGPVGRAGGTLAVVVHADNSVGDTEIHLTAAEAREFAQHVLTCADTIDPAGATS